MKRICRRFGLAALAGFLLGAPFNVFFSVDIAYPKHAPYGRADEEALRNTGIYDAAKNRLVPGKNISQPALLGQYGFSLPAKSVTGGKP